MKVISAAAALAITSLASAQPIISNFSAGIGPGTTLGPGTTTEYHAAGWTVGPATLTLHEVTLSLDFTAGSAGRFSIWAGGAAPEVHIADLSAPPQAGAGEFTFRPASPVVMEPTRTYWLRVQSQPSATGTFLWHGTDPPTIPTGLATSAGFVASGQPSQTRNRLHITTCYPNCDGSITAPILNVADFTCFLQRYAAGDPYANCDNSTCPPYCTINVTDFTCFLQQYAAGCP